MIPFLDTEAESAIAAGDLARSPGSLTLWDLEARVQTDYLG